MKHLSASEISLMSRFFARDLQPSCAAATVCRNGIDHAWDRNTSALPVAAEPATFLLFPFCARFFSTYDCRVPAVSLLMMFSLTHSVVASAAEGAAVRVLR